MKIEGRIIEVTEGEECDSIKVLSEKRTSTIKMDVGDAERFTIGGNVTITVDIEPTLYNRDTGEVTPKVIEAVKDFIADCESMPEGNSTTISTSLPGHEPITIKGKGKKT